jgi:hypothetical protein
MIKGQGLTNLMVQSDCDIVWIKFIIDLSKSHQEEEIVRVSQKFVDSPWYTNIIYVLRNLQAPPGLSKTKARLLILKMVRFCIFDNLLYWKDPRGILLTCLLEDDAK